MELGLGMESIRIENDGVEEEDDIWDIFDTFEEWCGDFDINPPVPIISSDESGISSDEGSMSLSGSKYMRSQFVDETVVPRWRVPESNDTVFARITAENRARRKRARSATEESARNSTSSTEKLTVSEYRKQQSEWLRKTTAEQLSKKKKHGARVADVPIEVEVDRVSPTVETIPDDIGIACDLTRPVDETIRRVELKIVEVLNYTSTFMRAMNEGNFEGLNNLMQRTVVPECVLKLYFAPNTFPSKIIPRDSISEYFRVLGDAVPDALWKIEDTRLRQGKPRTVISNFSRSGTFLNNAAAALVMSIFQANIGIDDNSSQTCPMDERRRTITGTVFLELNDELRVESFNVVLDEIPMGKF